MNKIGIFGGSFNPVHNMHITMAKEFCKQLALDMCYLIPSYISPFKKNDLNALEILSEHRLNMLKLAINGVPYLAIDDYELMKQEISYTINTVNYYREKSEISNLYLMIGMDQAEYFKLWKNWEEILKITQLCIAGRKNYGDMLDITLKLTIGKKKPVWLEIDQSDISSSMIRNKIKKGSGLNGFLHEDVIDYIQKNNLYRY